ncbi:hypothetical protein HZB07_06970 [Candidatus Saganbacteria bacterium]|nr:hypothetical protein [Candidatus Saganbacteria bacterium]
MKKIIALLISLTLLLEGNAILAQSKIIRKTIRKVVTPQIAPVQPPKTTATSEVTETVPLPPPPPTFEVRLPQTNKGVFGWGLNTDLTGKLLLGSILLSARGDVIFSDPLKLGEKMGLAEDAVEYKVGLGVAMSDKLKTIPLFADMTLYLKEGSLFGLDPMVGAGLIFNLYGTGRVSGGLGGQFYVGILNDFGFADKTLITLGYGTYNVGGSLSDSGLQIAISQPLKL